MITAGWSELVSSSFYRIAVMNLDDVPSEFSDVEFGVVIGF